MLQCLILFDSKNRRKRARMLFKLPLVENTERKSALIMNINELIKDLKILIFCASILLLSSKYRKFLGLDLWNLLV